MMQVLVVCVVLFFGAAELYQWMQGMELPMPVWVAAGVVLAIASNLNHPMFLSWNASRQPQSSGLPPASQASSEPRSTASEAPPAVSPAYGVSPSLSPLDAPPQLISFTICKSENHLENPPEDLA